MAAAMAAKQQRLWRWAWVLGPVGLAMMRIPDGVAFMFVNFVMGYAIFLPMAWYFRRRAADAERINREIYNGHRRPDKHGKAPRPEWTLKMLRRDKRT